MNPGAKKRCKEEDPSEETKELSEEAED